LILIFSCQQAGDTRDEKALDIHARVLTVDTHVDTPYMLLQPGFDITKANDRKQGGGQVDFPRMEQGGVDELDVVESVPEGLYTRETFMVLGEDGKWHKADLYRVANPQGPFAPAKSYLELMLEGAREHKMDSEFIKWLESMWDAAK
jgi:hypothetical protein